MSFSFRGKTALVVGLGKSGLAAAKLLHRNGVTVLVTESRPRQMVKEFAKKLPSHTQVEYGKHEFFNRPLDLIVTSPGVPWNMPPLLRARKKRIPVWPELELGWRFAHPKKTVAVTVSPFAAKNRLSVPLPQPTSSNVPLRTFFIRLLANAFTGSVRPRHLCFQTCLLVGVTDMRVFYRTCNSKTPSTIFLPTQKWANIRARKP